MAPVDHYEHYAKFYDLGTSTDNTEKVKFIESTIQKLNPSAQTLLEIACGTGNVLQLLRKHYQVSGLDLSTKMLEIAQAKLPDVHLYQADMTQFQLENRYDAILCIFDSINHLLNFSQWTDTFDRVYEHLNKGGVFIVDINTVYKMERFAAFRPLYEVINDNYQLINIVKESEGRYNWKIDIFSPSDSFDDIYKLTRVSIPLAAYPVDKVKHALKVRFSLVELSTADGSQIDSTTDRIYFICQKN